MADSKTSIGLIGCGDWGRHILRDLLSLGCEVMVVARGEATVARAADGGAHRISRTVDELPEVDGVVVATPTTTHAEVIRSVLDRGVPIFVEKPLAPDLREAERLAAEAPDRIFVMDKWRYHPGVELMGEIARSGELGRVHGIRTHRLGWGNPHEDVDGVWILAPHDLSIVLEILGEVPPARAAVLERVGRSVAGLSGLLGGDPWVALEVSTSSPVRQRRVTLHCEAGVLILGDGYSDRLEFYRQTAPLDTDVPDPEIREISTEYPLLRELRAFVEHVRGGPPPRSSVHEGAEIVRRITELRALAGIEEP
jgi:predicted dehydrogenase